ncbi:MAG: hypothetical protein KGL39_22760 [Patescibacteria group bacterium]|nr:hypothetical protein [Patescibacteria group bacterium]
MAAATEAIRWHCHTRLEKYAGEVRPGAKPLDVVEVEGNLLVTNGATLLWNALIGTAITVFSNANAVIGVGDGTTAAAAGDTDLSGTNKLRKAMDATYPSISTNTVTFHSTFATTDANFAWNEWGVFNAASGATSMLNHKVTSLGTKPNTQSWVMTVTLSLS